MTSVVILGHDHHHRWPLVRGHFRCGQLTWSRLKVLWFLEIFISKKSGGLDIQKSVNMTMMVRKGHDFRKSWPRSKVTKFGTSRSIDLVVIENGVSKVRGGRQFQFLVAAAFGCCQKRRKKINENGVHSNEKFNEKSNARISERRTAYNCLESNKTPPLSF